MDKRETGWWASRLPTREINYNIHVLPEQRLIYVATPKVACSTIKATLWQWHLQDPHVEFKPGQLHNKSVSPFKSPGDFGFEEFMLNVNSSEYTRICFVRNPYERLLSSYLDKVVFGAKKTEPSVAPDDVPTFADFLTSIASQGWHEADRHWRAQTEQLLWGDIHYDFVGRFESLMMDFNRLSVELGIDLHPYLVVRLGHAKQAHKFLEDYYTGDLQARAYELYRSDFEAFGYEHDLPSPDIVESAVEKHVQVEVRGWAFEPRNPAQTRRVAVYVDGRLQSLVLCPANTRR